MFLKGLRFVDRAVFKCVRLWSALRNRLAWAFTTSEQRSKVAINAYENYATFLPGGEWFEQGLFDWEEKIFHSELIPKSGLVMIGGCGGGREIRALHQKGYEILAFEPLGVLAKASQNLADTLPGVRFMQATYEEILDFQIPSTLSIFLFGWGSFSHFLDPLKRHKFLMLIHEQAKQAHVIISFFNNIDSDSNGDQFSFNGGFFHAFTRDEVESLAHRTGYHVCLFGDAGQGTSYAVLVPTERHSS